jgi:hypothetical protein
MKTFQDFKVLTAGGMFLSRSVVTLVSAGTASAVTPAGTGPDSKLSVSVGTEMVARHLIEVNGL